MTTHSVSGRTSTLSVEGDVIAGFRTFTLSGSKATEDATSADSDRWDELLGSRRSVTIDVDVLYVYDDIAQKVLDEHFFENTPETVTLILTLPGGAGRTYTGEAIVTAYSLNVPAEDIISLAATLQITDGLTTTTS